VHALSLLIRRAADRVRDDTGTMSLFLAVVGVALTLFACFTADAGRAMHANSRADDLAAEAARAAGQQLDAAQAIPGTSIVLDTTTARQAAETYLAQAGTHGTVTFSDGNTTVHVTVHGTYNTLFLGVVGYSSVPVTGHGTAHLLTQAGG
jgi:Flp pilus assembly protein TadG